MAKARVKKIVNIDASVLWGRVKTFDGMDKILPGMIQTCQVSGAPTAGAKRVCGMENGKLEETLLSIDHDKRTLSYSVDNDDAPLPVSGYKGTATITSIGPGKSEFSWSAEFEPKGMSEGEVVGMLEQVFTQIVENFSK